MAYFNQNIGRSTEVSLPSASRLYHQSSGRYKLLVLKMTQLFVLLFLLVVLPSKLDGAACRDGWFNYTMDNKCYKLFYARKSWNEARTTCAEQQAKLAEFKDFNTNEFIRIKYGKMAWIGAHRCGGGVTCFLNNDYIPYTPYASYEPDMNSDQQTTNQTASDLKEKDFAILIQTDGKWADEFKDNKYPYICEMQGFRDDLYNSCKSAFEIIRNAESGTYKIKTPTFEGYTNLYCQMEPLRGCSGGGWTLVMKANGSKETFRYNSSYWSNKQSYNIERGQAAFDDQETKLPTYWSMPFKEICLGMKVHNHLNFISIPYPASSLYDVIADGHFRRTNIIRTNWLSLVNGSILQPHCNKEGFNVHVRVDRPYSKVRFGILGNNENDCGTPDSFLGFGGLGKLHRIYCGAPKTSNSVGNTAYCRDGGRKNIDIPAMGCIFVR